MMLRDHNMANQSSVNPMPVSYPSIPFYVAESAIDSEDISTYVIPWCKRVAAQLHEAKANGIKQCLPRAPKDVKNSWEEI